MSFTSPRLEVRRRFARVHVNVFYIIVRVVGMVFSNFGRGNCSKRIFGAGAGRDMMTGDTQAIRIRPENGAGAIT
ncbi:hypothetical protein QO034_14370 [Sedimentitalea sp. JM2-8]|uniref:Uncharacterized protein n=1 Tax=Sedimentitalea xiamensis TaxID=3050037 RepID=A0ABT7FGT9_9RHOB|nr:hypothetical protein [Sedimentitalea xiamensis]MDK3074293.1 hypothetical protein [Sedimentitalea xiamensis]